MSTCGATQTDPYGRLAATIGTYTTVALMILDHQQRCVYLNPAAEQLLGYGRPELEARPLHDVVHPVHADGSAQCSISRALGDGTRGRGEDVFRRSNGTSVPVAYAAAPILEDGRAIGTLVELQDITERQRAEIESLERAQLAAFVGDIGLALTQSGLLKDALQRCAEAMVKRLDAAFARIWTLDTASQTLVLRASAGMYTHLDGAHGRVPVGQLKIGLIAEERSPHLTNSVVGDPRVGDQDWARREGMVAFAGYPLIVGDELVGVMAMFARRPLSKVILQGMASVASSVSLGIRRDRAERDRAALLDRVEQERIDLAQLFEQAPALVAVLDGPDHRFRLANPLYRQLLGGRDPLGKTVREIVPEIDGQGFLELLDRVYESGQPFNGTELAATIDRRGDGSHEPGYFNFVYQPIADENGHVSSIFVHAVEVTEQVEARHRTEELAMQVQRRVDELAAANRELEAFSYSVSHDLRAPLRAMDGFSRILLDEFGQAVPEEARRYLGLVRDNAQQMGQLVDDLLAFSRLNRQELARKEVDPRAVIRQVLGDLAPAQAGRAVELRIGDLPTVSADPSLLRHVYLNLLENALKFTRGRDPAIIEVGAFEQDGQYVYFVRDNGVGFDQRYADKLFGVFQRLHRAEDYEGTGVGTAIVQRVVHRHGGQVWAQSEVNQGATFFFTVGQGGTV